MDRAGRAARPGTTPSDRSTCAVNILETLVRLDAGPDVLSGTELQLEVVF